jgi:polysaccharide export outer membrane protein
MFGRVLLAFLFALLVGSSAPARGQEFPVQPGDLLRIAVFDNPDLTTETKVSAGGRIAFPLIGEIEVLGLTPSETQAKVATLLRGGFIKNPLVTVTVVRVQLKINVLGEFVKTGLFEVPDKATLLEMISLAGGLKPSAGDTLVVRRKIPGQGGERQGEEQIEVQLSDLLEGRGAANNFTKADGDSLYVPRASFVYVSGAVKAPGLYKIVSGLTVFRSITLAGGFTSRAAKGRVRIMRKSDAGDVEIKVRMDDLVLPDDVVVVPESFF